MINNTYTFIDYKIHYFREPAGDRFIMDELEPLPDIDPNHQADQSNKTEIENSNSNNPNSETNNSTNNHNKKQTQKFENIQINNDHREIGSFITPDKYDLVIGIAMYEEKYDLINNTLNGICENLNYLNAEGIPNERILIIIISDGKEKLNEDVYEIFTQNSLLAKEDRIDRHMRNIFSGEAYKNKKTNYLTSCLIRFVKSTPLADNIGENRKEMDILLSIKKENRGKLDSHFWLFLGFCKQINPKYIILLDTGTVPNGKKSLSSLILPFENDKDIAGTCGELTLNNNTNCTNMTLCAQTLEYKYAHVVDKNFESLFGYISVLPGAFSAYRWQALNNSKNLEEYFRTLSNEKPRCDMANMHLAEDRIFCWALFAMEGQANILRFIPDAQASTDAPEIYGEFMLQRRRWINGSNFAMFYVLKKYPQMFYTKHCMRQFFFLFLYIYYIVQGIIGYTILGAFYFVYYMICEKNFKKDSSISSILMAIYLFIVIFTIMMSLSIKPIRVITTNPQSNEVFINYKRRFGYMVLSFLLGLYNLFGFILGIYTIFKGGVNNPDKANFTTATEYIQAYKQYWGALALASVGLANFFIPLLYHPSMICLWIQNFLQYLLFQPTYAIILNVFAVCNIDDVSWGNRDSKVNSEASNYKQFKISYLFTWLIANFIVGWGFSYIVTNPLHILQGNDKKLINYYSIIFAGLIMFKLTGAVIGKFKYYFIDKWFREILQGRNKNNINNINNRVAPRNESSNNRDALNIQQVGEWQDANLELKNFDNNLEAEIHEENRNNLDAGYIEKGMIPKEIDFVNERRKNQIIYEDARQNNNVIAEDESRNLNSANSAKDAYDIIVENDDKGNVNTEKNNRYVNRVYQKEGKYNPHDKVSFPS